MTDNNVTVAFKKKTVYLHFLIFKDIGELVVFKLLKDTLLLGLGTQMRVFSSEGNLLKHISALSGEDCVSNSNMWAVL